ncbi:hypothetical protein TNCV_2114071 [Trichonephila clavipes]|nr:hypothetical protein TNCV_2114071 [Trichonephila clavipes]
MKNLSAECDYNIIPRQDGGEVSCSNLDSDEDLRLSESDCKKSEESADLIDNLVNPDTYIARDDSERITHNCKDPGRFAIQNALRQSSNPTSFEKHKVNVSFLRYKGS